jgi:DNA-binding response OmpR family regulator
MLDLVADRKKIAKEFPNVVDYESKLAFRHFFKPAPMGYLVSRIHAVLRRAYVEPNQRDALTIGAANIVVASRHFKVLDRLDVRLSNQEFNLLFCLMKDLRPCVPYHDLVVKLWGSNPDAFQSSYLRALPVIAAHLKNKIEPYGNLVENVPGRGYRLRREWAERLLLDRDRT